MTAAHGPRLTNDDAPADHDGRDLTNAADPVPTPTNVRGWNKTAMVEKPRAVSQDVEHSSGKVSR
jgi:hypothetical protein